LPVRLKENKNKTEGEEEDDLQKIARVLNESTGEIKGLLSSGRNDPLQITVSGLNSFGHNRVVFAELKQDAALEQLEKATELLKDRLTEEGVSIVPEEGDGSFHPRITLMKIVQGVRAAKKKTLGKPNKEQKKNTNKNQREKNTRTRTSDPFPMTNDIKDFVSF